MRTNLAVVSKNGGRFEGNTAILALVALVLIWGAVQIWGPASSDVICVTLGPFHYHQECYCGADLQRQGSTLHNCKRVNVSSHLNLRELPTRKSKVLVKLNNGERVSVVEELDNGWVHVLFHDGELLLEGYVHGAYLV